MSQTQFFALNVDLLPMLDRVESKEPLRYVRAGRSLSPNYESFGRGEEIPDLGTANYSSSMGCNRFLVAEPRVNINVRLVQQSDGVDSYHIDQLLNPDTIVFWPGGLWANDILLYGEVGTASNSEASRRLMARFRSAIKKQFAKINGYYVGAGALKSLEAGKRLTIAEQSPREFDLKLT
jgi:hypothetical protein